ncbi:MAG: hypothetical protein ACLP6G_01805 [Terriglobales bacterium]
MYKLPKAECDVSRTFPRRLGGANTQLPRRLPSFKGSDNSSTGALATAGYAILRGGMLTAATPNSSALEGVTELGSGYLKGTAVANIGDGVCGTTTAFTVTDCATTPQVNIIGIATSTSNPISVVADGVAPVKLSNTATIGHTVCMGTTTAGLASDSGGQGVCGTAGTSIGVVIATSGSVTVMSGNGTTTVTLITGVPLVQLHIGR